MRMPWPLKKIIQAHDDQSDKQNAELFDELMSGDPAYTSPDSLRPVPH